jgi:cell division protein FtsI (penicillin-binding protein 3)
MVERIGPKKLFTTCRDLGFGSKTGIKLQGEITGKLHSHMDWSTVSLGQIAMGHEVGVTAIQIATAYCAIANGGYLVRPRLIKHIVDDKNKIIFSEEPSVYRRICDSKTMSSIRLMLADVITSGTGEKANIPGWKVAGKTGTAQKWKDGKYSNEQFISNFVGFFPYDNPSILVFVMLDEPEQPYHWGSEGAAVAFKRIASRVINMDSQIKPPKKIDYTLVQNNEIQDFKVNSENDYHKKSFIKPLSLSTSKLFKHQTEVPEIRGYSMRKAMKTLRDHNLKFKIKGSGKVEWQSPRPGEVVNKGTVCVIGLK